MQQITSLYQCAVLVFNAPVVSGRQWVSRESIFDWRHLNN